MDVPIRGLLFPGARKKYARIRNLSRALYSLVAQNTHVLRLSWGGWIINPRVAKNMSYLFFVIFFDYHVTKNTLKKYSYS